MNFNAPHCTPHDGARPDAEQLNGLITAWWLGLGILGLQQQTNESNDRVDLTRIADMPHIQRVLKILNTTTTITNTLVNSTHRSS